MLVAPARRPATVLLLAALIAATVEITQSALPGRYPTFGDVVANAAGAWLGALLVTRLRP